MKKLVLLLGAIMIMTLTGCGKKEEARVSNDDFFKEIDVNEIEVEEIDVEDILVEQTYVSKEYLEEVEFNSQKNSFGEH